MAGISDEDIQKVRDASDLVAVIGERTPVKQKGRDFWCCCPLHQEKTPSFKIDPATQLWHCFGCGEGGDVFSFIMKTEDFNFPEAVRYLADRARIDIAEDTRGGGVSRSVKSRMKEICARTAEFYHTQLMRGRGEGPDAARKYLASRGFGGEVPKKWMLGYAPGRGALVRHLSALGFKPDEMIRANVALDGRGGPVRDRFYERVMFPIFDAQGDCVAFGGRVIGAGEPKYLNSQETPLFHKSQVLYGLDQAKARMASTGCAIVVEGYTDVIALHEAGVTNVVATLGTALTNEQIRLMKRYAPQILITYDGDGAGQRAIARGLDLFEQENVPARVTVVPGGMDPDEYVRAKGGQALSDLGSIDPTTYRLDTLAAKYDLSNAEARAKYAVDASQVLRRLEDPVEVERFVRRLTIETGFSEETLMEQVGKRRAPKAEPPREANTVSSYGKNREDDRYVRAEKELLAMICAGEKVPRELLRTSDFTDPGCAFLAEILIGRGGSLRDVQAAMEQTEDDALRGEISRILLIGERCEPDKRVKMMTDCIDTLHERRLEKDIDDCEQKLAKPGLTPQEQMELMTLYTKLLDRRERLKQGG